MKRSTKKSLDNLELLNRILINRVWMYITVTYVKIISTVKKDKITLDLCLSEI